MNNGEVRIEGGSLDDAQVVAVVTAITAIKAVAAVASLPSGSAGGAGLHTAADARLAPGPRADVQLWSKRSRLIRPSVRPGPGAWRASMMPR